MARTKPQPGGKKASTHDRIVRAAAKAIWRDGFEATSVAKVMNDAGLTHGGFYAHFPTRDAMLAEGLDRAADEGIKALVGEAGVKAAVEDGDPLATYVETYLSDAHLGAVDAGCTLAALGSELRRQSPEVRHVATRRLKAFAKTAEHQGAGTTTIADPLATLATLVGALVLARVVDDPVLATEIRASAAKLVLTKQPVDR